MPARTATLTPRRSVHNAGARPRSHNRHAQLLEAAAAVFRERGFALTTMRDIAAATGMTAGSIYYHYPSKGDLLLAVYAEGVRRVGEAFDRAVARPGDAWQKLHRAAAGHLQMMLGAEPRDADFASVFVQVQPHDFPPEHHAELVALRHDYEARFRRLVEALPLRRGVDRRLLRLQIIGALNHVPLWYRPEGPRTPAAIARAITLPLQRGLEVPGAAGSPSGTSPS
jgi:TetR/AcrR family transcriptional regulator, cholesterol catabolism regulator